MPIRSDMKTIFEDERWRNSIKRSKYQVLKAFESRNSLKIQKEKVSSESFTMSFMA